MKRHGDLYDSITSWDNLFLAAKNAQKGKRYKKPVLRFNYNLEQNLLQIKEELESQTYAPGPYRTFEITDNKKRMISAAPYRDRVVHHAICQVIVPIFENTYIHHSYAYQKGKGTHQAVDLLKNYAKKYRYVFRADIRKYFPSIDHEILKDLLRRKIKCAKTLTLFDVIIDRSNRQVDAVHHFDGDDLFTPIERRKGLPIGNLTSQHFANIYLNPLDHFVKEELRCKAYMRYVDDFVLLDDSQERLQVWKDKTECFLESLRLIFHPVKSQIHSCRKGITFLGYRVFPMYTRVNALNVRKARKRFRILEDEYRTGLVDILEVKQRIASWIGHAGHADSWKLRENTICPLVFQRG